MGAVGAAGGMVDAGREDPVSANMHKPWLHISSMLQSKSSMQSFDC